jgi:hypothetical protein
MFQQDGATCHTSRATMAVLSTLFGERIISKGATIEWPPRSPDLNPLDFWFWGYAKGLVYINKPRTLEQLKQNITEVAHNVTHEMLQNTYDNFVKRLSYCQESQGHHMGEVIFHK